MNYSFQDLEDERIALPENPEDFAASIDVPYIETSAKVDTYLQ